MPVPKQTTELIFSLRALIYRIRQLKKERHGYSKAKHRELAKLLKEGRDDLARIKTEDVIGNDNVIAALEILELYCEQLHVRANIVDHIALGQKRAGPKKNQQGAHAKGATHSKPSAGGGGWGIWKALGFGPSQPPQSPPSTTQRPDDLEQRAGRGETSTAQNETATTTEAQAKDEQQQRQEFPSTPPTEKDVYLDPDLDKAAAVIFYCYMRLPRDIPGLPELRAKLIQRWGSDFANKAQGADPSIPLPDELIDRLRIQNPPELLVENYLKEIAKAHGISWHQEDDEEADGGAKGEEEGVGKGETVKGEGEQQDDPPAYENDVSQTKHVDGSRADGLNGSKKDSTPQDAHMPGPAQSGPREKSSSGSTVIPNHKSNESATNGTSSSKSQAPTHAPAATAAVESKKSGIPDVDELARRFAALKK
ncbi:hypothetical protein RJZ56_003285 [Blastomyces dermatitidis]|uniref:DUF292 domain-containing protein n=2 Tax=Ajellomyces dermatitidis TaxID=5039 RepID=F2T9W4_AJEDA|nr:uncharacterized protein BDCG_01003 [Blastomyces dermatitidis ER-3]EEQ84198.1 hypothetical protein BDCG_01003 [Blastomyces dermatitidis ER-3]EGE80027.1 DUF292 domain-containing protein [Blastomyces dermatitidis ATCC 18188]EQL34363.1 hypothetical protein BDFG_03721 [Blastomyces dermatitidis ATCC 26199]